MADFEDSANLCVSASRCDSPSLDVLVRNISGPDTDGRNVLIVKNVLDLLTKHAWELKREQLDYVFECVQQGFAEVSVEDKEELLELSKQLALDGREEAMSKKVLGLLWNVSHNETITTEMMTKALAAHLHILGNAKLEDSQAEHMYWANKFIEEIRNDNYTLSALRQIREIWRLYAKTNTTPEVVPQPNTRVYIIRQLQIKHSLALLVAQNISAYMSKMRKYERDRPHQDPARIYPDGRYNHIQQLQERLHFLSCLLVDGDLWLCTYPATEIWKCLMENGIYKSDKEECLKWFAEITKNSSDLDPEILKKFMEEHLLQLDPESITRNGLICLLRFFTHVNIEEKKMTYETYGEFLLKDRNPIGLDYLWKVTLYAQDDISFEVMQLIKELFTNMKPHEDASTETICEDFIKDCTTRLKAAHNTGSALNKEKNSEAYIPQESGRMVHLIDVLRKRATETSQENNRKQLSLLHKLMITDSGGENEQTWESSDDEDSSDDDSSDDDSSSESDSNASSTSIFDNLLPIFDTSSESLASSGNHSNLHGDGRDNSTVSATDGNACVSHDNESNPSRKFM